MNRIEMLFQLYEQLGYTRKQVMYSLKDPVAAAYNVAKLLWINKHPENELTEKLRNDLLCLMAYGHFPEE